MAAPTSIFFFGGGEGGARKFLRGRKTIVICLSCQIWAYLNTFKIILGANGGWGILGGRQIAPCPLVTPPLRTCGHKDPIWPLHYPCTELLPMIDSPEQS